MDLRLQLKQEPGSPLSYEDAFCGDLTFYQTTDDVVKAETDLAQCHESKSELASIILEDLENLMDLDELIKEEEPFLLDVKMLPMLEEVEPPRAVPVPVQDEHIKLEYRKQPDTQSLLYEFQSVYDVVGFTNGALTPPQSPPTETPHLTPLEPLLHSLKYTIVPAAKPPSTTPVPEKLPLYDDYQAQPTDIARELAVVDELVRTRVEDMHWSTSAPSSPSSSSSGSSTFGDSSDDPEWVPESVESQAGALEAPLVPRKRSKPYSRHNPDEKKSRKKEQNKNAATRYRLKKKAEVEEIQSEEKQLQDKNTGLGAEITDLQREIKYLKGLMRDLFKAKGLIH